MFKRFLPIILLTFVNVIGFSLLIPVLQDLAVIYTKDGVPNVVYALLVSIYSVFQFICAPILGSLSDKYGRKPILILSQLGTTLSWIIFALAHFTPELYLGPISLPIIVLLLSRIVDGATGGNISVAQAWLSDMTTTEEKPKAFGLIGATFGFGFLFGPTIGGLSYATSWGLLGTAVVAFGISLVTLVVMIGYLPESLKTQNRDLKVKTDLWTQLNIWAKFSQFRSLRFVWYLFIIRLVFTSVFSGFGIIVVIYMRDYLGLSALTLGMSLSVIGVYSIFNQVLIAPRLAKKLGLLRAFYLSSAVFFGGLWLLALLPVHWAASQITALMMFYPVMYVLNLGMSLAMPTFKTLLVTNLPITKQGLATGLDEALIALGNSTAPFVSGLLYTIVGKYALILFALLLLLPHIYVYLKTQKLFIDPSR